MFCSKESRNTKNIRNRSVSDELFHLKKPSVVEFTVLHFFNSTIFLKKKYYILLLTYKLNFWGKWGDFPVTTVAQYLVLEFLCYILVLIWKMFLQRSTYVEQCTHCVCVCVCAVYHKRTQKKKHTHTTLHRTQKHIPCFVISGDGP